MKFSATHRKLTKPGDIQGSGAPAARNGPTCERCGRPITHNPDSPRCEDCLYDDLEKLQRTPSTLTVGK